MTVMKKTNKALNPLYYSKHEWQIVAEKIENGTADIAEASEVFLEIVKEFSLSSKFQQIQMGEDINEELKNAVIKEKQQIFIDAAKMYVDYVTGQKILPVFTSADGFINLIYKDVVKEELFSSEARKTITSCVKEIFTNSGYIFFNK